MTTEPVDLLSRALDQTKRAIAGVRPEQATNPTPCDSWDVQTLVAHLVHDLDNFTVRARGGNPDWTAATPTLDRDWTDAFGQGADQLLDDWRAAGDLSGTIEAPGMGELPARFPVDQQVAEFATHTWDLMTATDQHLDLDPEVGRAALDWARGALQPAFRGAESEGKAFGPEVPAPADAPVYEQLAAFFGRRPR